ncbi:MAG TPA: CpsD/CapB family tyrosine-protein kinase [Candidatus Binatia bacterium]|nr:CpsD/CapB family tyrosine-protein kinase [Candidatus Binatia bacterium]
MSKVYEALRQKEYETTGSGCNQDPTFEKLAEELDSMPVHSEPGIVDPIFQAAFTLGEEERELLHEVPPLFCPPSVDASPESSISPNGFRRLRVGDRKDSRLVFQTDPHGLAAEQFRFLRRNLEQKFPQGAVLLMTSPAPKDGKTLTSLNLCCCLADTGRPTLLLEGDIRKPSVHALLGGENIAPGVEDALSGAVAPAEAIHVVEELSFHVAMVANPPAEPSRLISGTGPKQFLEWAKRQFDWIVIDSPPVLPAADVTQLMQTADAVLLVVRTHSTPRELAIRAFELLGNRLSGVVLNGATVDCNPYYRYLSDYCEKNTAPEPRKFSNSTRS